MTWRAQGHVLGIQESRSPGGNTCLTWRAQGTHQVPLQPGCCLAISLLPGQALSRDSVEAEMIPGFCHLGRVQPWGGFSHVLLAPHRRNLRVQEATWPCQLGAALSLRVCLYHFVLTSCNLPLF